MQWTKNPFHGGVKMKKNIGSADKTIRTIAAVVFAGLIATKTVTGSLAAVLGVLAVVFAATALIGTCPLYLPFGFSTFSAKKK
jgi:hypothetical protein